MSNFFTNLPGVQTELVDGNLQVSFATSAPRVLVIGTASKGINFSPVVPKSQASAKSTFGSDGTLVRGTYEVRAQGASNVACFRIGGSPAILEGIGVDEESGGYTLTTDALDDDAGDRFSVFYDKATGRLAVYDVINDNWILDTEETLATAEGDGQIVLTGTPVIGDGTSIGSQSAPVLMSEVTDLTPDGGDSGWVYQAGTDGLELSRMEMYEELYKAYDLLDFYEFDIIVPMDVYLDDLNVADLTGGEITALGLASLSDYPGAGDSDDALGLLYTEEYLGKHYFWWDMDSDGIAEIYPSVGSASATTKIDGSVLDEGDFHEVNFSYQLATFCHKATQQWRFVIGVTSFKLPTGYSLAELAAWIGKLPSYTTDPVTGDVYIASSADNGTGILGNKFLAGRDDFRGGVQNGGFISTDDGWIDGEEETDVNDKLVDLGKYLSVVASPLIHTNNFAGSDPYISTWASSYAGMIATLGPASAPTNKVIKQGRMVRPIKATKLDDMAGVRIVGLASKAKGLVISDAPSAARPTSDFTRLTTVRIVKDVVDRVFKVADPFIGEGNTSANRSALETAIETELQKLVPTELERYDFTISATAAQKVAGQAQLDMVLICAFELRTIPLTITLAAE